MGMFLAPLAADKVAVWTAFMEECQGARKGAFEELNHRHKLTKHEAWLAHTPAGAFIIAVHEGPGSDTLMPSLAQSTNDFDKWFVAKLAEIHGMDLSKPPPGPPPERKLSWHA